MTKRRHISLLPSYHQTTALSRFFDSTVDQLFSEGETFQISGYIGRKPDHYDPNKDFYKVEPSAVREKYQLEPLVISETDGEITSKLFYDDMLSLLGRNGSPIDQPSKMFGAGYYSWCPPIDIDRLMNFQQYYWSGSNTTALELVVTGVEIPAEYRAATDMDYALPPVLPNRSDEDVSVLVNGIVNNSWALSSGNVVFSPDIDNGALVQVFRYGNISDGTNLRYSIPDHVLITMGSPDIFVWVNGREETNFTIDGSEVVLSSPAPINSHVMVTRIKNLKEFIEGNPTFNPTGLASRNVTELANGMRVKLIDPLNWSFGFDLKAYGHAWDEEYDNTFFVEGVDIRIELLPTNDVTATGDGYAQGEPQYIVAARDDASRSYWSKVNRWVHVDSLIEKSDATNENRAKRPIIQFSKGLKQFNYGSYRIQNVSGMISEDPLVGGTTILFDDINGIPEGSLEIDNGFKPRRGDYVITNMVNSDNNIVYYVDATATNKMVFEPVITLENGAVTSIGNKDFYFQNGKWNEAGPNGHFPLFDLYDSDGVSLGDENIYPDTTFSGSRIFNYHVGTGRLDAVLGIPLSYDKWGQINFNNELETVKYSYRDGSIDGYYYYNILGSFQNSWHWANEDLVQDIDANNISVIPLSLQANPDFETPKILSKNDFFAHFSSIMTNQDGFTGKPYSNNNWNDTAKDVSKGLVIIQHEAPLLKLAALLSSPEFDVKSAIKFSEREFNRQKSRLLKYITEISEEQDINLLSSEIVVELAMKKANAIKTESFPFSDTNVGGRQWYLPYTPALLGITPLVKPAIEYGEIIGHDGSRNKMFNDARDDAILTFETAIYNNALQIRPSIDMGLLFSAKFREGEYTNKQMLMALKPFYDEWVRENGKNNNNDSFSESDPFTWNYSNQNDRFDEPLAGNWRGIYRYYFDTERPNTHPWEMLGMKHKPSWWETRYGPAPYTRDNIALWDDISQGKIAEGTNAGVYSHLVRPNLMQILPIGKNGEMLDPVTATIVLSKVPVQFAKMDWNFGDGAEVEQLWRNSSSYCFAVAQSIFKLKPSLFVERFWDIRNEATVHNVQKVQLPQKTRIGHRDIKVNRETENGSKKTTTGIQNWIIDHLINQGLSPSVLGDKIRGLGVSLGHKVAGFTTKDRMTVWSEGFGLVPDDDVSISLYESPNNKTITYSGVLIQKVPNGGWKVIGYDANNQNFDIIDGEPTSKKIKITLDGKAERTITDWAPSVYYKKGMYVLYSNTVYRCTKTHTSASAFETDFWTVEPTGNTANGDTIIKFSKGGDRRSIPYGSVLYSKQEVADLMFGMERKYVDDGFVFDSLSWVENFRKFLQWSTEDRENGEFIALSPAAREITIRTEKGLVSKLDNSLINRTGNIFSHTNYTTDRFENDTVIASTEDDIFGATLNLFEVEHCLIFSNKTIFDDIIFDPLYNIRQDRLKLSARLAKNWNGKYESAGFVLDGNDIKPNFNKLSQDVREMFDIEKADNTILRDHARHLVGFENRAYLENMLLNETQQFELYKGMIQQKGSYGALSSILRSDFVGKDKEVSFLEEWAFKVGTYGAFNKNKLIEFGITEPFLSSTRKTVHFGVSYDDRWVPVTDNTFADMLVEKTSETYATSGFARIDEVRYFTGDIDGIDSLAKLNDFAEGERIWVTHTQDWDVLRLCHPTEDRNPLLIERIDNETTTAEDSVEDYRISFNRNHSFEVGDHFVLSGSSPASNDGLYTVLRKSDDWVEVEYVPSTVDYVNESLFETTLSPNIHRPETMRFATMSELTNYDFDFAYIGDQNEWTVVKKIQNSWVEQRRKGKRIENKKIVSCGVSNDKPEVTSVSITTNPPSDNSISVVDPLSGLLVGAVEREISFKLEYDPADYSVWGTEEIGLLWWDTSTARFVECYTDAVEDLPENSERYRAEINYRTNHWASIMPSSSIDIYEWSKTTLTPDANVRYISKTEYSNALGKLQTVFYYWKKSANTIPKIAKNRRLSAAACRDIILNPSVAGIVWNAAMSPKSMILSGAEQILNDTTKTYSIQIVAHDYDGEKHTQWALHRPNDTSTPINKILWDKLLLGLRGFDRDLVATSSTKSEIESDIFGAISKYDRRSSVISMINYMLARKNYANKALNLLDANDSLSENMISYGDDSEFLPNGFTIGYDFEEVEKILTNNEFALLDNRNSEFPSYSVWEKDGVSYKLVKNYDMVFEDVVEADAEYNIIPIGTKYAIENDENANGFWTIWEKTLTGPILVKTQLYRTSDFWFYANWYGDGYFPNSPPAVQYSSIAERTLVEGNTNPINDFVKISNDNGWFWSKFVNGEWEIVAQENGTIQLSQNFVNNSIVHNGSSISTISNRDGSIELPILINKLFDNILGTNEKNELWYSALHTIHTKYDFVDWAFKTSFVNILNYNERIWNSPVAHRNSTDSLTQYLNEAKPYRARIRDIIRNYSPDMDVSNSIVTDFDKPVYYDDDTRKFRVLDETLDEELLSRGIYRHYTENQEFVRKFDMNLLFDRVWGSEGGDSGAVSRIMAFYQPSDNMMAKSIPDLLSLDFKGTIYDGKSLDAIQSDMVLIGSTDTSSQIEVDGGELQRTGTSNPEELVKFGTSEGFNVLVSDRWGDGSPQHMVKHYDVSELTESTLSLDIGLVASDVSVFVDGLLVLPPRYELLNAKNTITISREDAKQITIHIFGFAATKRIAKQHMFKGGTQTFDVGQTPADVEVRVNNVVVSSTISGNTVSISAPCTVDDAVIITVYTETALPIDKNDETLVYNSNKEWQLSNLTGSLPFHTSMIVHKNGLRLTPPTTLYSDGKKSVYIGDIAANLITIYDDDGTTSSPADISTHTNAEVSTLDDAFAHAKSSGLSLVWDGRVVLPSDDINYSIVTGGGDFSIDDDGILSIPDAISTDTIVVTSFTNSEKMKMKTYSFAGSDRGIYPIRSRKNGRAWLTVDGKRLVENVDYAIIGKSGSAWDIDPFDSFRYDSDTDVQFALKLPSDQSSSDVVITTFEGRENNSETIWQISSKVPTFSWFSSEEGVSYIDKDAWDITLMDGMRRGGEILSLSDDEITIKLNPYDAPDSVIPENPFMVPSDNYAGVLWCKGERIEYFGYEKNGNQITFSSLRRNTRGTSLMDLVIGDILYSGDALLDRYPTCPKSEEYTPQDAPVLPKTISGTVSGNITITPNIN